MLNAHPQTYVLRFQSIQCAKGEDDIKVSVEDYLAFSVLKTVIHVKMEI